MRHPAAKTGRLLLIAALASALMGPAPTPPPPEPTDASGDDIFLLTTSVSPLVVLLLDNSASMQHVEWHPAYDPTAPLPADCDSEAEWGSPIDFTQTYAFSSTSNENHCGNARRIFALENPTLYTGHYLAWLFSDASDAYENEIRNATAFATSCTASGGADQFNQLYRRRRFEAAKHVLLDLLCRAESKNVRFALALFRENKDLLGLDPNGAYLSADLKRANANWAAELESEIKNSQPVEEAPLSEGLFQVYTYYMPRIDDAYPPSLSNDDEPPLGQDGVTQFPRYQYDKFGNYEADPGQWPDEAIQFTCDKAFVIVVSDGLSARDDFDLELDLSEAQGFASFAQLIGDYNADGEVEDPGSSDEGTLYLDDIAKYMAEVDFRPDFPDDQTIDVYTIGFATDAAADALLQKTADVGDGLFFDTQDGEQLGAALIEALNDIVEKAQSFTAASVPSARTVDGGDFYQSYFFPSGKSAFWEGHVRAWHIEPNGDVTDANGVCALDDPDTGECNSGFFKPSAEYFWDAADEVPLPADRNLHVSKLVSGAPDMVPFDSALSAADLALQAFAAPPDPAPNDALYPTKGSKALNAEGLADEVVAFARGCVFGTGVETADVAGGVPCGIRPARFGDVFHSNPLIVKRPSARPFDASYLAFRTHYDERSRVLYAGTNAGFLEAVHAGTWQPSATPFPKYDPGTGAELFGFMPWEPRLYIKNQPVDSPTSRTHYVDADAQAADVWMYPSADETDKAADGSEWRTVLVGGLREGGRHYYALDITNPDGIAGPDAVTLDYPGYLWEFPREDDPSGHLPWMGSTFGQPIMTRVRVQNSGDPDPKPVYERWVAIVTAGYAETGDPNPPDVTNKASNTWSYHVEYGRGVFVIDVKTGEVLAEQKFVDDTGSSCPTNGTDPQRWMCYAVVSSPAVFDLDGNGFADTIYVGDLGGNVWKWAIHAVGEDRVNDGSGLRTQPAWRFRKFFDAPEAAVSGETFYKNFYFPPAGGKVGSQVWVAFGSGERRNIGFEGVTSTTNENNRFYIVRDDDPWEVAGTALPTIAEGDGPDADAVADLVDATASPAGITVPADRHGYFFRGGDGEKFVTRTEIFGGYVITASFTPVDFSDPCTSRGEGTAYVFDLLTGEGYFTDAANNPTRGLDIGVGLPTDPKTSVGVGGNDNRVYIEKSGADLESFGTVDIPAGGRLLYWREAQ
jgi:type IV pilus assembly protein PilY1